MKKIREVWNKNIIRPMIYMTLTRFGIGVCSAYLLDFFFPNSERDLKLWVFTLLVFIFIALAWIAWLRLDGIHLPRVMNLRWSPRKKPVRTFGDMIDHIDDDIVTFDELENDEKDVCCLIADLVCAFLFLVFVVI